MGRKKTENPTSHKLQNQRIFSKNQKLKQKKILKSEIFILSHELNKTKWQTSKVLASTLIPTLEFPPNFLRQLLLTPLVVIILLEEEHPQPPVFALRPQVNPAGGGGDEGRDHQPAAPAARLHLHAVAAADGGERWREVGDVLRPLARLPRLDFARDVEARVNVAPALAP